MKPDIYHRITARIIADLEAGTRTWLKPWNGNHPAGRISRPLRANGLPYRGINVLMLWAEAATKGFAAPIWMTFHQARELGGHVRKGEQGTKIVYAGTLRTETDTQDSGKQGQITDPTENPGKDCLTIPFLKAYTVFNVEQIEGLPASFYAPLEARLDPMLRIDAADRFFAALDAQICQRGDCASYNSNTDTVSMPPFEAFHDPESYYATLAHELIHWTSHPTRLNRDFGRKRWGDEAYAKEELVAELGAAFLSADLDLAIEPRPDHADYIASWLKILKQDQRAIFTAAAHAQRATEFLHARFAGQNDCAAT